MPVHPPPALENPFHREATLGYSPPSDVHGLVRCVSHGTPSPLIRWHYHTDYELHLVVATSGKFFVGDYIGHFAPGNLVLTGPRLPHNWISTDAPPEGVPLRDHCIVFQREPIAQAAGLIPELAELLPLLDQAAQGIEFFGFEDQAVGYFERVAGRQNLGRLVAFLELLEELLRCGDYRLLSSQATLRHQTDRNDSSMALIDAVVNYLSEHCAQPLAMADVARRFHLSESHFSRVFRRGTGNTFTDFLIRVRISRACQLLAQTDEKIASVGFDAGFHNLANFNRRFLEVKGCTPSEFRLRGRAH